jgi:type I restriction enzyme S subunit
MKEGKKITLTPKLRFPEFREPWAEVPLSVLALPISDRVGTSECVPYTVTSGVGLVSQHEKFGRTIAGNSLSNYIRLRKDDFAYNKSATKAFPEGYIARYLDDVKAAVPNSIFTCFRADPSKIDPAYLDFLFAGNLHGRWLRKFLTIGARAHGSLNVSDDDLMALPVPRPSLAEQQRIAACLTSLDKLLAAEGRKLEALQAHKQGLMQRLFPRQGESFPRLRFPEFRDGGKWDERTIGGVCELNAGEFVPAANIAERFQEGSYPCYGGNGLRGYVETFTHEGHYVLVGRQGALCGNVSVVSGRFHATEHALVATPKRGTDTDWLLYALDLLKLNRFATGQAQPGLSVGVLNDVGIAVPKDKAEQHRIAVCLFSLDGVFAASSRKLDLLRAHKNGLMRQLFPSPEAL